MTSPPEGAPPGGVPPGGVPPGGVPPDGVPPGAHVERTRFAWRRTVLVAGVVALLLARMAVERGTPWLAPVTVAGWVVVALGAQHRIRALAADEATPLGRRPTPALLLTLLTLAYAAAATLILR